MHYAAYNGHPNLCKALLKWEADQDKLRGMKTTQNKLAFNLCKSDQCKWAFNNIWRACKEGDLDMVRILLREGEDVNEPSQFMQDTGLNIAAQNGHVLIVKYLIQCGAIVGLANAQGKSAEILVNEAIQKLTNDAIREMRAKPDQ